MLTLVHSLSKWGHRTMHYADTDEKMASRVLQSTVGLIHKGGG